MEKIKAFLLFLLVIAVAAGVGQQYLQDEAMRNTNTELLAIQQKTVGTLEAFMEDAKSSSVKNSEENQKVLVTINGFLGEISKKMDEQKSSPQIPVNADPVQSAIMLSRLTDPQIRQYAMRILGRLPGKEVEARAMEIVKNDPESSVKQAAYDILRQKDPKILAEVLMAQLEKGSLPEKAQAAQGLAQVATKGMEDKLFAVLKEFPGNDYETARVRRSIYQAMRKIADPSLCKRLIDCYYAETNESYRYEVANALANCASTKEIDLLCRLITEAPAEELKKNYFRAIMEGLGRLNDIRTTPAIMLFLSNKDYSARQACEYLLRNPDPLAAKAVVKYYDQARGSDKSRFISMLKERAFPGIAVDGDKLSVVDEAKMKELLADREKRVATLIEADKRRNEKDIF